MSPYPSQDPDRCACACWPVRLIHRICCRFADSMAGGLLFPPRQASRASVWLPQSAAGSALGRMVIRLGRHFGFRTINVVRRREQGQELLQAGADAVICTDGESIEERVQALTDGTGVPFALDPVGGTIGSALV